MAQGLGIIPSVLIALLVGLVVGGINGLLVAYGGIQAFVATLATMTAVGGAALYYTNGATLFKGIPEAFLTLGQGFIGPIPVAVVIMLVVVGVGWVVLGKQARYPRAALSGVPHKFCPLCPPLHTPCTGS